MHQISRPMACANCRGSVAFIRTSPYGAHRGRAKRPQRRRSATTYLATVLRQVWCWDVTWLPSTVAGRWYYLFLIVDLYSRKVVGYEVHVEESGEYAADLLKRIALAEGLHGRAIQPVLRRQRCCAQRHHGTGHAALAGDRTVLLASAGE